MESKSGEFHIPEVPSREPRSALELIAIALGIFLSLASAVGTYSVLKYRVDELESERKDDSTTNASAHKDFDGRIQNLEDAQHSWETTYDHRLTVVESQNTQILNQLQRIEDKLDRRR